MSGVRFPFLLSLLVLGWPWPNTLATHDRPSYDDASPKIQRLDLAQDTPMKIIVNMPNPMQSQLFASCFPEESALVRFRYLHIPDLAVEFTRYVPNSEQQELYDLTWEVVQNSAINTSLACAAHVQTDSSAMMYQFDGSECRTSTLLMPMTEESCGDLNADAVFIRTSCPEPTVPIVTLTPAPGAMDISWTIDDPCQQAVNFEIHWANIEDDSIAVVDTDVFYYRIEDHLGCETQTVTVTVLDSFEQPYGAIPTPVSADTMPRGPPTMETLNVDENIDHVDISWTAANDECLRITGFVVYWGHTVLSSETIVSGNGSTDHDTYEFTINELHACLTLSIEVWATYDNDTGASNKLSETIETDPEEPAIENLSAESILPDQVKLSWDVRDFCNSTADLKLSFAGNVIDLDKYTRSTIVSNVYCPKTFVVIPIDGENNEFGSRASTEIGAKASTEPAIENLSATWILPGQVELSWDVEDLCNSIEGLNVTFGENVIGLDSYTRSTIITNILCHTTFTVIPIDGENHQFGSGDRTRIYNTDIIGLHRSISSIVVVWGDPECNTNTNVRLTWNGSTIELNETIAQYRFKHSDFCQHFSQVDYDLKELSIEFFNNITGEWTAPIRKTLEDKPMPGERHLLNSGNCLYYDDTTYSDMYYSHEAVCVEDLYGAMFIKYEDGDYATYQTDLIELTTRSPPVIAYYHFIGMKRTAPNEYTWLSGVPQDMNDTSFWNHLNDEDCVNTIDYPPYTAFPWGCTNSDVVKACHEYLPVS